MTRSTASLAHLLRLVSPTLPVGAYSYSQGLEWAIESGTVRDEATALSWISDALRHVLARFEAPISLRLYRAWNAQDITAVHHWNDLFLAARESAELYAETVQMGYSLKRLLNETMPRKEDLNATTPQSTPSPSRGGLGAQQGFRKARFPPAKRFACANANAPCKGGWGSSEQRAATQETNTTPDALDPCSFPAVFSYAALTAGIDEQDMLLGLLWAWAENQAMAALKAVPLGQAAGQRILCALIEILTDIIEEITALDDDGLSNFAPGFAITCSLHETQYSRLFRS